MGSENIIVQFSVNISNDCSGKKLPKKNDKLLIVLKLSRMPSLHC